MAVQLHDANENTNHLPQRIERKFYLLPQKFGLAYGLLQHICRRDSVYPSEQINSLYFDTSDLDQYDRSSSGDYRKDKIRIRWYGQNENLNGNQTAFLELKSRRGFSSSKQRLQLNVPAENLAVHHLRSGIVPKGLLQDTLASFGFFSSQPLQPIIKISYWRHRFCDILTGQKVSLDSRICSTMIMPGIGRGERGLKLPGAVIEFKGISLELPLTLRRMNLLDLDWSRFSKYSACIDSHNENPGIFCRLSPSGRNIDL